MPDEEFTGLRTHWHGRALAAHSIHVLALEDGMISKLTLVVPPTGPRLFHAFVFPFSLPDAASAELPFTPHQS